MKSSLTQNPDLETIAPVCCVPLIRHTRIILGQFFSAIILTMGTMVTYGPLGEQNYTQCAFISLAMFYAFIIAGQLSGGHGNPSITIALMFTRGAYITWFKAIIYIISQFAGAIAGAAIAYGTIKTYGAQTPDPKDPPLTFGRELLGTFFFTVIYLLIMSASTKMQRNFWNYILVPVAFYIARMISAQYAGLNPAVVLANQIFFGVASFGSWEPLQTYWIYIIGPLVGSVVGSVIFNFFLLPYHRILTQRKK